MIAIALAVLLASAPVDVDIGPPPTMAEFSALAEPALASRLRDPQSAVFRWPYQLVAGPAGYFTCGLIHARDNRGRYSDRWVSAVVAKGQLINYQSADSNGMLAYDCARQVRRGTLIPR